MLIEMGDFGTARRSLNSLKASGPVHNMRKVLLLLKIGDVEAAKQVSDACHEPSTAILKPLLSMADGRFADSVEEWRALLKTESRSSDEVAFSQNLAVCLLYTDQLNEVCGQQTHRTWKRTKCLTRVMQARVLLESLVSENHSFASLTFNLATIYELCSDKSTSLKRQLAEAVAKQPVSGEVNLDRPNSDFKL